MEVNGSCNRQNNGGEHKNIDNKGIGSHGWLIASNFECYFISKLPKPQLFFFFFFLFSLDVILKRINSDDERKKCLVAFYKYSE